MKESVQPGARRRVAVAALAAVLTLSVVSVVTASARPAGRPAHARRVSSELFDSRAVAAPVLPGRAVLRARAALARSLGSQGVVIADPRTGTLRMVGRLDGFLTGANVRPPSQVAMDYVGSHLRAFGLNRADLRTFQLRQDYVDIDGTHHISWTQRAGGVTAFQNGLKANVASDGRLINLTGSPVHGLRVASSLPQLGSIEAIDAARRSAGAQELAAQRDDTAKLVLFPTQRGARISWQTTTWIDPNFLALSVVDAQTGRVLWRANLTHADAVGTGQAVEMYPSGDLPNGGGDLHPVTFPVFDGTALSGNNAHVYADVNDDNKAVPKDEVPAVTGTDWSGYMPQFDTTTVSQNCSTHFYCTWDKTVPRDWNRNRNWFGVQLYHFLNTFHDHLLAPPIGFTEAAGNFQVTNSTGLGQGDDPVEGQFIDGANTANGFPDGGHVNNANFSTPPDGQPGIMQMYLQRAAPWGPHIPSGDSGNEAETVYHEFTHGLSNRLVTTPDGIPALNAQESGSMGEAWSDWYAIDYTDNNGWFYDTPASGDAIVFRYSAGDEVSFRTAAVDCPVGVTATNCPVDGFGTHPGGYTYADFGKIIGRPEVHTDGEIWLQTLWEMREQLGSAVTESIVTRGMELSPPDPSFLDMRNAILQADEVVFAGLHQDALWALFAERGMGYYAAAADGNDVHPVANFDTPPNCAVDPCGSISGTITDSVSGAPLEGVHVGIAGHMSGLGNDLDAETDAAGTFSIAAVPFHSYEFVVDQLGYEPATISNLVVNGDETVDRQITRDWAATEGGATVGHFSPPDYTDFGCGPQGVFDLSLGTGWGSDAPGPRSIVVKLPKAVDVTSFGFDPGNTCGDGPDAATRTFTIYTKKAGGRWVLAYSGGKLTTGRLNRLIPSAGASRVRFVKLVLLTNRGNPSYMDASELTVRGA